MPRRPLRLISGPVPLRPGTPAVGICTLDSPVRSEVTHSNRARTNATAARAESGRPNDEAGQQADGRADNRLRASRRAIDHRTV